MAPVSNTVVLHTTLIGLTPLIPAPFVDDLARGYFVRRLVRSLADEHGLALDDAAVAHFAKTEDGSFVRRAAVSAALYPVKRFLQKTFLVLQAKRVVDTATDALQRGYLIDVAFARGLCAPAGARSADEIAAAVDAVCRAIPGAPVERALKGAFEQSKLAVGRLYDLLAQRAREDGIEVTEETLGDTSPIVERVGRVIASIPSDHFAKLERAFDEKLENHRGAKEIDS